MGPSPPYVIGGIDLDGDGTDEIWARTGWSAQHPRVGLFAVRDGRLSVVRFEDGRPAEFDVGDRPKYPRGAACEPQSGGVLSYIAERDRPAWEPRVVNVLSYRLVGTVLEVSSAFTIPDDESVARLWRFACGSLRFGG